MYATNDDGKVTLIIKPNDDTRFKELLCEVDRLQKELNQAVHELMFYSHEINLSCSFNTVEESD